MKKLVSFLINVSIWPEKNRILRVLSKINKLWIESYRKVINSSHIVYNNYVLREKIVIWWNNNLRNKHLKDHSWRNNLQYRYKNRCSSSNNYRIQRSSWSLWKIGMNNCYFNCIQSSKWWIYARSMNKDLVSCRKR